MDCTQTSLLKHKKFRHEYEHRGEHEYKHDSLYLYLFLSYKNMSTYLPNFRMFQEKYESLVFI